MINLLECEDLTVRFGGLVALHNVTLSVANNSTVGIIGPNGSGKTTFFNTLTGIYTPSGGNIKFGNKVITGLKPHLIARMGIVRTFQNGRLFLNLTVLENILIGRQRLRNSIFSSNDIGKRNIIREVEKAYSVVRMFGRSLAEKWDVPVSRINQGDRRKVEICRAQICCRTDSASSGRTLCRPGSQGNSKSDG
ncbi:MAG: ATP-binding cassette domain-containing protein [Firmicutes bacterium]|nr:ATP-binding cassette domain-containing protein [Bacillota bacterium]